MRKIKIKFLLIGLIVLLVVGLLVMILWNFIMPVIFNLPSINYWQALALFFLSRILFGAGFMGRGMKSEKINFIRNKWMKMSPEQRKEFVNSRKFAFKHFCEDFSDKKGERNEEERNE